MDRSRDDAEHDGDRDGAGIRPPFTLTSEGVLQSCKPWRWIVREVTESGFEMLVLFEPDCGEREPAPGADDERE